MIFFFLIVGTFIIFNLLRLAGVLDKKTVNNETLMGTQMIMSTRDNSEKTSKRRFWLGVKYLGLRESGYKDNYADEGCWQFREECKKHSISVSYVSMPNICIYIRVLEMKGLHLELQKDCYVKFKSEEGEYLGSEAWQNKWFSVIFSSNISGDDFCECIKIIMNAHNFDESRNIVYPYEEGYCGKIDSSDSTSIYRALYIMHYNIFIKQNNDKLKAYEVSSPKDLHERIKQETVFNSLQKETYYIKEMKDIVRLKYGHEVPANKITLDKKDYGIIYPKNVKNGEFELFTGSIDGNVAVHKDDIILGVNKPFDIMIWNKSKGAIISDGVIGISPLWNIASEYLYLYLVLMCYKFNTNGVDSLKYDFFCKIEVVIVPSNIQREIIKKGMPVKDDAEQLEAVFSSYNEAYPMLRLVSK